MSRRRNRTFVTLALLAALTTAPAAAWGGRRDRDEARFDIALRTWMVRTLERVRERVVGVWEQAGSTTDPDG